jgi:hypothetical protein
MEGDESTMPRRQRLDDGPVFAVEVAARDQLVGQALCPIERPGLERGQELTLVNDSVLKCDQSHEEMVVSGDGHGVAPNGGSRSGAGPGLGARPRYRVASGRLSQVGHAFASARDHSPLTTHQAITAVSPSGHVVLSAHLDGPSRRLIDAAIGRRLREGAKSGQPR